jgi:7-cyano-7-deazaguanine synthase in queuosine biosynthesis
VKNLLLFSSGKDSVLSLYRLYNSLSEKDFEQLELHHINYGQFAAKAEIKVLKHYAKKFKLKYFLHDALKLSNIPDAVKGVTESNMQIVPFRNPLFIFWILNKTFEYETPTILYLGLPKELHYGDGHADYLEKLNNLVNELYPQISLKSVVSDLESAEVFEKLIVEHGAPKVMFCYSMDGSRKDFGISKNKKVLNCGRCWKCRYAIAEMRAVLSIESMEDVESIFIVNDYFKLENPVTEKELQIGVTEYEN